MIKLITLLLITAFSITSFGSNTSNKEAQQILLAAQKGELKKLKSLLAAAVKPIWLSDPKFTVVSQSILRCSYRNQNQIAVLKLLSEHAVDFNYPLPTGDGLSVVSGCRPYQRSFNQTALEAQANTVEIAKFLISKGANTKRDYSRKKGRGLTALRLAIQSQNEPLAIFLLEYSDLSKMNIKIAQGKGLTSFISELINTDRNLYNLPIFRTALQSPSYLEYQEDVVRALLNKGFDPNAFLTKDGFYQHPIALATSRGNIKAVELLMLYGAKTNVTDAHGRNLLDIALKFDHLELVKLFESLGLTPSRK